MELGWKYSIIGNIYIQNRGDYNEIRDKEIETIRPTLYLKLNLRI
jgi:hypothetical protein